jgi:hypothetical protein
LVVVLIGACDGEAPPIAVPATGWDAVLATEIAGSDADGAVVLELVTGAVRLADGTIVVADALASALKFFSPEGDLVRTVGRHGRGPQEFTTIGWLGLCGNRIVAFDDNTGTVALVSPRGDIERRLQPSAHPTQSMRLSFMRCAPDGRMAFAGFPRFLPGGCLDDMHECLPMHSLMSIADRDGVITDTIGEVFGAEMRPLGSLMQFAVSNHALFVGASASDTVDVYDLNGRLRGFILLELPEVPPTTANYDYAIGERVAMSRDRAWQLEWIERMRRVPMPEVRPRYSGLFVSPGGILWAVISYPGDTLTWLRSVNVDGNVGPDLRIPHGMRVLDMGDDYVIGTYEHEGTGDPHVVVYHLEPRG